MDLNKKLEELKPHQLNCNVFDVYSYNGLTMQDLLCQFFTKINECINVSNETIDLAKWLVNEGLEIEVVKKLMVWLEDGTLENVINVNLFKTLNDKISQNENKIDNVETNLKSEINDVLTRFISKGGDDTLELQNLINNGCKKIRIDSNITLNNSVYIKSDIEISATNGVKVKTNNNITFIFEPGVNNVTIKNIEFENIGSNNVYCFDIRGGDNEGLADSVRNLIVKDCRFVNYDTCFNIKKIRQSIFDNISVYCNKGINYFDKSAEFNIVNSYFIQHGEIVGSYGLKSFANGNKFPEGLIVDNVLFYNFERNLIIEDLYVSNFSNCHIDAHVDGCKPSLLKYNIKNEQLSFDSCWFLGNGLEIGDDSYNSSKTFKMKISNCKFDDIKNNCLTVKKFTHQLVISNNTIIGNGDDEEKIALVCDNLNDYITFNNNSIRLMNRVFILNGVGTNNTLNNNTHDIKSGEICYSNYVVNSDLLFNSYKTDIPDQQTFTGGQNLINSDYKLKKGMYIIQSQLNEISVNTNGYLKITTPSNIHLLSNNFIRMESTDKHLNTLHFIMVDNEGEYNLKFGVESGSITTGYVSSLSIIKI